MHVLDTNICIYLIKKQSERVLRHLEDKQPGDVGISAVTFGELDFGVKKSEQLERNARALVAFVAPLVILPFDDLAARSYGSVRADLERRGKPIGALDTMIAGHCLAIGATLVTNNMREFSKVRGLSLENWTR